MNSISAWVLSVAGISVLGVLVELILPNGQTKKYIKGVFAFVVVLIIIMPLPKLLRREFKAEDIFKEDAVIIQDDFVYEINRNRLVKIEEMIELDLKEKNISGVEIRLNANIFTSDMVIDSVFVDLNNLVLTENLQHKDINEIIVDSVLKYVNIQRSDIIIE